MTHQLSDINLLSIPEYSSNGEYLATIVLISALVLGVFFFVALIIIRRHYKQKIIELEQRILISQLNPHFIFNSLTAIQSYIFRNEPYYAGKYLANFSKLIRLILENSRQQFIPIAKEKETLNYYLDLQAFRFDGKFDYTISISPDIDEEHFHVPPMLAQPFIENSIEHGIIHLGYKGKIDVRYSLKNDKLIVEIEDNGIGIGKAQGAKNDKWEKHKSLATLITQDRLKNLKKVYGKTVKMHIEDLSAKDSTNKQGTLITFTIPQIVR